MLNLMQRLAASLGKRPMVACEAPPFFTPAFKGKGLFILKY